MSSRLVIGVGNEFRGDDAVGRIAARRIAEHALPDVTVRESTGEALSLMESWRDTPSVIVIDAVEPEGEGGAVQRFDATEQPLPTQHFYASTHAFSVADAIEMARSLGQLPPSVVVYGIQAVSFEHGAALSEPAKRGVDEAVRQILAEISQSH